MKRVLCVIMTILTLFCCSACNKSGSKYDGKISEYRDDFYVGQSADYNVELITGSRENPFEIDGKTASLTDYSLLTIVPVKFDSTKALTVKVEFGDNKYDGAALKHPYKESYSFEIPTRVVDKEVKLTVIDGDKQSEITLKSVKTGEEINGDKALELAENALSESLKQFEKNGVFVGEIFVRYIENPLSEDKKYFWYVAFIPESNPEKIIAALLDPVSGELKATRK